jgi:exodeoxyribonuclease VII large subunit
MTAMKLLSERSMDPDSNTPEYSVSELSGAIKRTMEDAFGYVKVKGEVSGYRGPHSSGHVYFALKDTNAKIEAVIWKGVFGRLKFRPEEGMEVVATGKISTFPGKSSYQIVIEQLEPAGIGALLVQLEERKKRLAAEGLFDAARKQPLPFLPAVIGVITSPTGAVIRDILHRISDRFPRTVLVWPVRVQGETCASEVANAIRGFNALSDDDDLPRPDVLIVARGGGSLEDLWGFNEEIVARAAAESEIPLISAVGHETDTTLIDYVSDRRAPTPTGAAEFAVPVRAELLLTVQDLGNRKINGLKRHVERLRSAFRSAARAMPSADALLSSQRQRLDFLGSRLPTSLATGLDRRQLRLNDLSGRLSARAPAVRLATYRERLIALASRLASALPNDLARRQQRLERSSLRLSGLGKLVIEREAQTLARNRQTLDQRHERLRQAMIGLIGKRQDRVEGRFALLASLGPHAVLKRGYVLVRNRDGAVLRLKTEAEQEAGLVLTFADGDLAVTTGEAPLKAPPRAKPTGGGQQGSLF